jgi:hypothetical protein
MKNAKPSAPFAKKIPQLGANENVKTGPKIITIK